MEGKFEICLPDFENRATNLYKIGSRKQIAIEA
jgi:hypothetical protein